MSTIQTPEDRVLDAIDANVLTDGQISTATGMSRQAVQRVLKRLEEQGRAQVVSHLQILNLSKPQWGRRV